MLSPPAVVFARRAVASSLYKAVEGSTVLADAVASPPVGFVKVNFVAERVVDADVGASCGNLKFR